MRGVQGAQVKKLQKICNVQNVKDGIDTAPGEYDDYLFCAYTASTQKLKHDATLNLLQGIQADKHIWRQSRQAVVAKDERPVGNENDTKSNSQLSTPAEHERMRGSTNTGGSGQGRGRRRISQWNRRQKDSCGTDTQPLGHMTTCFECFVCSLRHVAQAGKCVCWQSR
jgi:hypothetical protein